MRGLIVFLLAFVLIGCKQMEIVPVERVHRDTTFVYRERVDSVMCVDSVMVDRYIRGDTMCVEKIVTRYRDRLKVRVDTFVRHVVDSVEDERVVLAYREVSSRLEDSECRSRRLSKAVFWLSAGLLLLGGVVVWLWRRNT